MNDTQTTSSPQWSNTTKLVVGLTFVALIAGLVIRFRAFLIPLLLAFMLTYLLYPVADQLRTWVKIPWRLVVTLIYLVIIAVLAGLLTWGGIQLVEQVQSLVRYLDRTINELPELIVQLTSTPFFIGPFYFDLGAWDLGTIGEQVLSSVQPMISSAGSLVGSLASTTATTIGWTLFVLLISFFILAETEGIPGQIINLKLPGYQEDFTRMGTELAKIWNAFLRGQVLLMALTLVLYSMVLGILGVRFAIFLAVLAGLARLVPYVGPTVAWTTYGIVCISQASNPFDLEPLVYALMVVGVAWLMDTIFDNMVTPRVLGDALQIHPAAVLVAALVAASLLGLVGVILAGPVMATLLLFARYATRKMFDLDPWPSMPTGGPPPPITEMPRKLLSLMNRLKQRLTNRRSYSDDDVVSGESKE